MGVYSPPGEVQIFYDNGSGTPVNISNYVLTINGVNLEQIVEEVSGFNETQERFLPVGKNRMEQIELSGVFRTGVDSPDELFRRQTPDTPDSTTRTLKIIFQQGTGGLFMSVETYVGMYNITPDRAALTKYTVRLAHSTGLTWGTNP